MKHLTAMLLLIGLPIMSMAQTPYYPGTLTQTGPVNPPLGGAIPCDTPENIIANCSFETGDLTGWIVNDLNAPFLPVQAAVAGGSVGFGFFLTEPTDGTFVALHGFDGDGPGVIELAQDVTLPLGTVTLTFDYRGAWDLATFGAAVDRTFEVQVQPTGGGVALQTDVLLTAPAGDITTDTSPLTATVDLSAFAGNDVRVAIVGVVPEVNTGPAQIQIDNVSLIGTGEAAIIPTLSQYGLLIAILLLAGVGLFVLRRKPV